MIEEIKNIYRVRVDFGKIKNILAPPPLIDVQISSYEKLIQQNKKPNERENNGLEEILSSFFPIEDQNQKYRLEYISYNLGKPKYDTEECRGRGTTYSIPMSVKLRLIIFDVDTTVDPVKKGKVKDIKEQEIYFGDFPLMLSTGHFIINGTERVVVSQLHRSAGVFFLEDKSKTAGNVHRFSCTASIIPSRGPWIDFEFDSKDTLFVKINKKKKIYVTTFLKALGYSNKQILEKFYPIETISINKKGEELKFYKVFNKDLHSFDNLRGNLIDLKTNKIIKEKGERLNNAELTKIAKKETYITLSTEELVSLFSVENILDEKDKEIITVNQLITKETLDNLFKNNITKLKVLEANSENIDQSLRATLVLDKTNTTEDAMIEIYKKIKSVNVLLPDKAKEFLETMFFNKDSYDLSKTGRIHFNKKFNLDIPLDQTVLTHDDIFQTLIYLFKCKKGKAALDDIDHLKNRRVRSVGELLGQCLNKGIFRIAKSIKEKMVFLEDENITLPDLVNVQPVIMAVHKFFATSQLSQFMDQTNPLSEITHKRRVSALGPGGLVRERAGFEVRDVHPSHYGRICPIETPEGPSIGLMSSLTIYAKLNDLGFIETPYRKVINRKLTNEVSYMSPLDDNDYYIAQSNALLDKKEVFIKEIIALRRQNEFRSQPSAWAQYIDLAPQQLISVAASLIPFLDHDDANRALMGSNMQRQSVPLVIPEAPFVGTGMEHLVARDSGVCLLAEKDGIVDSVDSKQIVVENTSDDAHLFDVQIYKLKKYLRSNQNTCINQIALVKKGQKIKKGQIIADGPCCESGELALGKNILVAFMPWYGYNYEDSIVVSEKLLHKDVFTSVHIEKFDIAAMDTKVGRENITRDVPNASDYIIRHLDDSGIVRIGSYVKTGDILVGKTTPKSESQLNPEEKLLRAVFGDKAGDIKNSSLKVPQGISGVVIDVKVFNRRGIEKDNRTLEIEEKIVRDMDEDHKNEIRVLKKAFIKKNSSLFEGQILKYDILIKKNNKLLFEKGKKLTKEDLNKLPIDSFKEMQLENEAKNKKLQKLIKDIEEHFIAMNMVYSDRIEKKRKQEELGNGYNRVVKVYIAMKRKLSVGDKMSGRHGNKGVISKILPVEDMPYTKDGMQVDLILNPLSVPSRMNIGQVLETHLGLVSKGLSNQINEMLDKMAPHEEIKSFVKKIYQSDYIDKYLEELDKDELIEFFNKLRKAVHFSTPVFDGAKEADIHRLMDLCSIDRSGKVDLYDGKTGDKFTQQVTIGYKYMCKLYHLIDDKLHARSIGPYSLVTQQPLGGKSQFGGQRFGEMEVWALEAYGAAYVLRELLTVKSDDIFGRNKLYEAIVKGNLYYDTGVPESFRVLINEIRSLCIDLKLVEDVTPIESDYVEEI